MSMATLRATAVVLALLFLILSPAPAGAKVFYVGNPAEGCNASTLAAAVLGAVLSGSEPDEIRLTTDLVAIEQTFQNWDPASLGSLKIRGGFASCAAATPSGRSRVSGTPNGPVVVVTSTGGTASEVTLENLILRGASNHRGVTVSGSGASVRFVNSVLQENRGGLEVTDDAHADLDYTSLVTLNDVGGLLGGGILCSGATVETAAVVEHNFAGTGGGVFLDQGCALTQHDGSWIQHNEATWGGGMAVTGIGSRVLRGRIFDSFGRGVAIQDNTAHQEGGGVWVVNSATAEFAHVWLRGNRAGLFGGGIYAGNSATVAMDRVGSECFVHSRCSWLEGNALTDPMGRRGSAVLAAGGARVYLLQTFIENNTGLNSSSLALHAVGSGTLIQLEGVQYANNRTWHLFSVASGARIVAGFISAAANRYQPNASTTLDSEGGLVYDGGILQVYSSILADHRQFNTTPAFPGTVHIDCSMVDDLRGVTTATRTLDGLDPMFVAAPTDLRVGPDSMAIDYCDTSAYSPLGKDLALNPRGFDVPTVADFQGPYDIGAYERRMLLGDGFEDGDLSRWD